MNLLFLRTKVAIGKSLCILLKSKNTLKCSFELYLNLGIFFRAFVPAVFAQFDQLRAEGLVATLSKPFVGKD